MHQAKENHEHKSMCPDHNGFCPDRNGYETIHYLILNTETTPKTCLFYNSYVVHEVCTSLALTCSQNTVCQSENHCLVSLIENDSINFIDLLFMIICQSH